MPQAPEQQATPGFLGPDYLDQFAPHLFDAGQIRTLREERQQQLFGARTQRFREAVMSVKDLRTRRCELAQDVVTLGGSEDLNAEQSARWLKALQEFCPWKKGPFSLFGTSIDAEWRSDWKWSRIAPLIDTLQGQRIADIGCHNGYFMFRMAAESPACVVGFEPVARHQWNFQLLQNLARRPELHFELLGVEHVDLYPGFFDKIFCLGILYHHTDPVGLLRKCKAALAPKGELYVDCQGIPGDLPLSLTPRGRYANARGIWFLPTQSALEHWMIRAGFSKVESFFSEPLSPDEQRRTSWADVDSLKEALDPHDPTLTIEGYPAPWRHYIRACRS